MGKCIGGITHDVFGSVERLPTILLALIWILLRGMINRILEFKLKGSILMVEVRGLILPMMVKPTLIDLPRKVRV